MFRIVIIVMLGTSLGYWADQTYRIFEIVKHYVTRHTKEGVALPDYATGACAQTLPELRDIPEIRRLLLHPADCSVYRGIIPAGEILSAPGSYLSVTENFPLYGQQGKGKEADLATLEWVKKRLIEAGWQVGDLNRVTTMDGLNPSPLHAEFRRILPDKTRQYFYVETETRLKLTMISLPTPRIDLRLPKPATLVPHLPSASEDRFPELPPFPGLIYQGFSDDSWVQYSTPADAEQKRDAYSWWAPPWTRHYRYDQAKVPALAAALLYKDALRNAGWLVVNNYNFQHMPLIGGASAKIWDGDRELVAGIGFYGSEGASVSLIDVEFQRQVGAVVQQWKQVCVATIPGLEFSTGQSNLSDAAQAALETLLEARRISLGEELSSGSVMELRGRADPTGNRKNNLELAAARANAVKKWLVAHEVPPESLSISAFGDWETGVADEATPKRAVSVAKLDCTPRDNKWGQIKK